MMNRDSNAYTFGFAAAMVVVVASVLAFTASSLKDLQQENVRKEKMQNILATIGIETDRDGAETLFNDHIVSQLALRNDGTVDDAVDPFSGIKLALELKKDPSEQRFPLYLADVESESYYIIPLRGSGLWDAIWGYIALESDRNTIKGAVFDHKAETAGLGAEITQQWFMDRFVGEKVFDDSGSLVGISVSKTNNDPKDLDKNDHEVDAISGATITGDGVSDMIMERLTHYQSYLTQNQTTTAVAVNE
jgi:Na+-transporting NADH:ubiquinone oxidoreductase subunit C